MRKWLIQFGNLPKGAIIAISFFLIAFIGLMDIITGYEISISLFYLIPISLTAWLVSRRSSFILVIVSSLVWMASDIVARPDDLPLTILLWNAGIRFGFFTAVCFLLTMLKAALEREKLLASTDYLTGIFNSRFFLELADRELKRMRRHQNVLSAAYLDVDDFKKINDNFGHKTGDKLLTVIADTMKRSVRDMDIVARLGGDEFIIMMPLTGSEQVRNVIGRVYKKVTEALRAKGLPATISIGAATFVVVPLDAEDMITKADSLMYVAKKSGKNKIEYKVFYEKG